MCLQSPFQPYLSSFLLLTMKHVPNVLTIGRMVAAPLCLFLVWTGTWQGQLAGAVLFILAAISDYYDGKLARRHGASTRSGRFLDPLADKVLVLGAFILLPFLDPLRESLAYPLGLWFSWLLIGLVALRDIAVTVLRMSLERRGRSLQTSRAAKWKTTWQLTFLITVLVFLAGRHLRSLEGGLSDVGNLLQTILASPFPLVFLVITVVVTIYTGGQYFVQLKER